MEKKENGRQDVRVIKTKRALAAAMLTLLEQQDFQSITVNDLCTEAMVSRSTFYVYFEDKYALLAFCLGNLHRDLFPDGAQLPLQLQIRDMLERIQANVKVFKNMMMVHFDDELFRRIQETMQRAIERKLEENAVDRDILLAPPAVVSAFCAAGITNATMHWVRSNMPCSAKEMAQYLINLLPTPVGA